MEWDHEDTGRKGTTRAVLLTAGPPGLRQADVAHLAHVLPTGPQQAKRNHSLES